MPIGGVKPIPENEDPEFLRVSKHEWVHPFNCFLFPTTHVMRKELRAVGMQKTYNKVLLEKARELSEKGTRYDRILSGAPKAAIKAISNEYNIRIEQRAKDTCAVKAGTIVPAVPVEELELGPMEKMRALEWATQNLGSSEVVREDAPNSTAWAAYQNMQADAGIVRDVYKQIASLAKDIAKAEIGKADKDSAISIEKPMKALEKFGKFREGLVK